MLIAGIILLLMLAGYGGMIYLRKFLWDAVHRNLLDLEDHFGGRVMRRSFAARPVFHGKLADAAVTLNFSSERKERRRLNYIDVSIELQSSHTLTITDLQWAKQQNANPDNNCTIIANQSGRKFVLRPFPDAGVEAMAGKPEIRSILDQFDGLAYLYAGKNGIMCEFATDDLVKSTEFAALKPKLDMLQAFAGLLRG
jgi:hypothetical protein